MASVLGEPQYQDAVGVIRRGCGLCNARVLGLVRNLFERENTSIAEPAAEPTAAPDDADGVLVDSVPAAFVGSTHGK